jgi:two-component system chemotaxis response regulator CheY
MVNRKPRILVVDDFETVRLLFIKCLGELGIEDIVQAEDGQDAMTKMTESQAKGESFDLVFCDWNMPVMNGLELLQAVRKLEEFKETPFVMVTANSDENAVVEAMRAGVSEYLVKPFDTRSLGRTVQRVVARFKAAA